MYKKKKDATDLLKKSDLNETKNASWNIIK